MAFVQELFEIAMKAKPWTIVNEYESGLYFFCGDVMNWRIYSNSKLRKVLDKRRESTHGTKITLEELIKKEKEVNEQYKKTKKMDPDLIADGWRRYMWIGSWEHPERYTKNRPPGIYWHFPEIVDWTRVEKVNITEVVKELKFISIFNKYGMDSLLVLDSNNNLEKVLYSKNKNTNGADQNIERGTVLSISGFIRYEIEDAYKAYTQVTDWEKSYQSLVLMLFTKNARKMTVDDWFVSKSIKDLEDSVRKKLNKRATDNQKGSVAREEWGIWTSDFVITDISPRPLQRYAQELYVPDDGLKLTMNAKIET